MAPTIPPLAQSESKSKFFERLDLNKDDPADKHLYASMKVIVFSDIKNRLLI